MTPVTHNLTIRRGITFGPLTFEFKDDAGDPVDLTGWQIFADVRKKPTDEVAFSLEPEITDAEAGIAVIEFTDEETDELTAGSYGWDLVLQNPDGERLGPYLAGRVSVKTIYTQPE